MAEGVVVDLVPVVAHVGGNKEQQRRFGLVEVGDDPAHDAPAIAQRGDHDLRGGLQCVEFVPLHVFQQCLQRIAARECCGQVVQLPLSDDPIRGGRSVAADAPGQCRQRFQRPDRGGADGRDEAPFAEKVFDCRAADLEVLGVHGVAAGVVVLDRQEGPGTHVQRHFVEFGPCIVQRRQKFRCEVQSGRRCGDRSLEFRIDRLVARIVDLLAVAVQIGRNRDLAQMFEQLPERKVGTPFEPHDLFAAAVADAIGPQLLRCAVEFEVDADGSLLPLLEVAHDAAPLARPLDGKGPFVVGRCVRFEAEDLDAGARRLVHDDAGPDHLRVVEDQHRTRRQDLAQIAEVSLGDRSVAIDKQFRGRTFGQRKFCNAFVRQRIVVVVDVDVSFHGALVCRWRDKGTTLSVRFALKRCSFSSGPSGRSENSSVEALCRSRFAGKMIRAFSRLAKNRYFCAS